MLWGGDPVRLRPPIPEPGRPLGATPGFEGLYREGFWTLQALQRRQCDKSFAYPPKRAMMMGRLSTLIAVDIRIAAETRATATP